MAEKFYQQRGLPPRFDGSCHGKKRDNGFAAANVALQQA